MSDKDYIKSLVKEAELYRTQGLLDQSKEKYLEIFKFVKNHERYSKDNKFMNSLKKKLGSIEDELTEFEQATETPDLSPEMQSLINKLFSFSQNKDMAKIEGAVALAKFGQYEKALEELERLIKERTLPLLAATNTLRCHLTFSSSDAAIDQLKRWESEGTFFSEELNYLRSFLENILQKDGAKEDLPKSGKAPPE